MPGSLPPGWFEHQDASSRPYFYNELTKFSTYERPRPLPEGWRLEKDKASGTLYYWNYWTRDTFPFTAPCRRCETRSALRCVVSSAGRVSCTVRAETVMTAPEPDPDAPLRRALFLAQGGLPPPEPGQRRRSEPSSELSTTSRAALEALGGVAFVGWSSIVAAGADSRQAEPRFFLLTCGPQTQPRLAWYVGTEEQLVEEGSLDLRQIAHTRRTAPDSPDDFSFCVATRDASLAINPGSRDAFNRWQDGLLQCVAAGCAALPPAPAAHAAGGAPAGLVGAA